MKKFFRKKETMVSVGIKRHGESGIMINDPSGKVNVVAMFGFSFPPKEGEPWPICFSIQNGGYQIHFECENTEKREEILKRVDFPDSILGEDFFEKKC